MGGGGIKCDVFDDKSLSEVQLVKHARAHHLRKWIGGLVCSLTVVGYADIGFGI